MLGELSGVAKIYLVTGRTDMRKSIDGLMGIIKNTYNMDPFSNALYLFCGRKCDRIKALHFDRLSEDFCYPHISWLECLQYSKYLSSKQKMCG